MHDLAPFVTTFFVRHLPVERNVSPNTTAAYRDALKLLLRFVSKAAGTSADALQVEDLTPERLLQFLTALETTRRNSVRTRNARLAAIHSFFRYVLDTDPELVGLCQRVLAIPRKKTSQPVLTYLSDTELAHLLGQIDRSTITGERDYLLIALLYDTGARISGTHRLGTTRLSIRRAAVCTPPRQGTTRAPLPAPHADCTIGASLSFKCRAPRRRLSAAPTKPSRSALHASWCAVSAPEVRASSSSFIAAARSPPYKPAYAAAHQGDAPAPGRRTARHH